MTVSSTVRRAGPFLGNGTQTVFPFEFKVLNPDDLLVAMSLGTNVLGVDVATLEYNHDYSVQLNVNQEAAPGGSITLNTALATDHKLAIISDRPYVQEVALTNLGGFFPVVINKGLDNTVIQTQQLAEALDRAIKVPVTDGRSADEYWRDSMEFIEDAKESTAEDAASALDSAQRAEAAQQDIHENWQEKLDAAAESAETAVDAADRAKVSEEIASAAADAALIGSNTYPDEPTGRAAVADGEAFKVQGQGWIAAYEYRRINASSSVLIATYPSAKLVDLVGEMFTKENHGRAPYVSFDDPGGYFFLDENNLEVAGPNAIIALQDELYNNTYRRAPFVSFSQIQAGGYDIDPNGAVVDGPAAIVELQNRVNGTMYRRAPLTSFDASFIDGELDPDGRVVGGPEVIKVIDNRLRNLEDSGGTGEGAEPRNPVFLKDGMLQMISAQGEITYVDMTPYSFYGSAQWNGKHVLTAINRATLGAITPVAVGGDDGWIGTTMVLPCGLKLMFAIISFGQSNSVGAQAYAPPSVLTDNKYPDTLLMCDGPANPDIRFGLPSGAEDVGSEVVLDPATLTDFKPLVAMQSQLVINQGATVLEGMGYSFADAVYTTMGIKPKIVMGAAGWGGRFQSDLAKGSIPYQNYMTALTRIKELAEAKGYVVIVPFIPLIHGESDSTREAYMEGIKTWQADFNTDIKAITGQLSDVPMICTQASTFSGTANTYGVLAPYFASELATTHHLGPPYYPYPLYTDNLHLGPSGALLGEKIGHVAARVLGLFGTKTYGTIRPMSVFFDSANTIDITFTVPTKPLVRDTTNVVVNNPAPADWGFKIRDGSNAVVPITSISIVDGDTVRIVTATTPAPGEHRKVEYALSGFPASPKVTGQQPRGQLRDSTNIKSITEPLVTLYDWCPHFWESF